MFDLNQLRQFVAVAESENISKAADRLNITQPALSRSLQNLESELGFALFERTKNRIHLSEMGKLTLPLAQELLDEAERMQSELSRQYWKNRSISVGSIAPSPALMKLRSAVKELYPEMRWTEEITDGESIVRGLHENTYQLGIFPCKVDDEALVQSPFLTEQLYAILPSKHPLAERRNGIYLEDIDGEDIIPFPLKGYWNDLLEEHLPNSEKYYQTSIKGFDAIVRASTIISFTSDAMLRQMDHHVNIPILDDDARIEYHIACTRNNLSLLGSLKGKIF